MRRVLILAMVLAAAGAWAAPPAGELGKDARELLETAQRLVKAAKFGETQERILRKALTGVSVGEMAKVLDLLHAGDAAAPSRADVLRLLAGEVYPALYGKEPLELIEGFPDKIRATDADTAEGLLAASLALTDFRLAFDLARRAAGSEHAKLRVRAALALGDLVEYGHEPAAAAEALANLLSDKEVAVRAVAGRRAFMARVDAAVPWALAHLDDQDKQVFEVRGEAETLIPGEEAMAGLRDLTRIEDEILWAEFRALTAERRDSLVSLWKAFWDEKGGRFPAPGFREAAFRPAPSTTDSVTVAKGETTATLQFWSGLDRTKIRVAVDDLSVAAASLYDFNVNFHVKYMAQGMRMDDGEDFARRWPVGHGRVLARKAIGCYVLTFQHLLGDRVRVFLRFHDPAGV